MINHEILTAFAPTPRWNDIEVSQPLGELTIHEHAVTSQERLGYIVEGGTVRVAEEGHDRATMSFVAYSKPTNGPGRPITLVMNGGPLSPATLWNHTELFGPWILHHKPNGHLGFQPKLEANEHSLLDVSDIIFLDPVGTGYGAHFSGEDTTRFFGVENDTAVAAAFLEAYVRSHNRGEAPKILAGSSYGALRMVAMANQLQQKGQDAAALFLISGGYDYALNIHDTENPANNRLASIANLPSFAVAALHHERSRSNHTPEEQYAEAAHFAWGPYAEALRNDTKPSRSLVGQVAAYTGLDATIIEANGLQVPPDIFQQELLGEQGHILSGVDTRLAFENTGNVRIDPALDTWEADYKRLTRELFSQLDFDTEKTPYNGILVAYPQWTFANAWQGRSAKTAMQELLNRSSDLRIVEINGLYDLLGNQQKRQIFWEQVLPDCETWQRRRMPLDQEEVPQARTVSTYEIPAGHQPGTNPLSQDIVGQLACRLATAVTSLQS